MINQWVKKKSWLIIFTGFILSPPKTNDSVACLLIKHIYQSVPNWSYFKWTEFFKNLIHVYKMTLSTKLIDSNLIKSMPWTMNNL